MILFIRDNECFEPRVKNYIGFYEKNKIDYHIIAWNRNGKAQMDSKITFFEKRAEYGKRLANIPNKALWILFTMKQIYKHRKTCTSIHACDIDAIIPAIIMGKLLRKTVVYDIFDWISSLTGKGFVYKLVEFLQNYAYKKSNAVILCEEERKSQAKSTNDNILIIPNIPNEKIIFDENTSKSIQNKRANFDYTISYVGVFDKDRGLENLLNAVSKNQNILLNIAGFGVLDDLIKSYAERYPNICYWGRVEYSIGQSIMKCSDLIAAMYYLSSPLHKYAAPNKYYESLLLEVPMITTENTLVGSKTQKYNTGFVLDETEESLLKLFDDKNLKNEIEEKRANCKNIWDNVYSSYYDNYMQEHYLPIMKN